jgi:hypothetical protein
MRGMASIPLLFILAFLLWLSPVKEAQAGFAACAFASNKDCLKKCCGKGRCPKKKYGQCPVIDKKLRDLQKKKTTEVMQWWGLQEMATNQLLNATLLTGETTAPLGALESALVKLDAPGLDYNLSRYACLPRHEEILANKLVTCTPQEGDFTCRIKTMAYALESSVLPSSGVTTPNERTQTANNQRACYYDHATRVRALGEIALDLLRAYQIRVKDYMKLVQDASNVPCYDPKRTKISLFQIKERYRKTSQLMGVPNCLREDFRILSMLERDTALLHLHRKQLLATTELGKSWAAMQGNRNPATPE